MALIQIVNDLHGTATAAKHAAKHAEHNNASHIVLNGDIFEPGQTPLDTYDTAIKTLTPFAETNLPTYIQPGSIEDTKTFNAVIEHFQTKHPNIHSTLQHHTLKLKNHAIQFLPGNTNRSKHGNHTLNTTIQTGHYQGPTKQFYNTNPRQQLQTIQHPQKTTVIAHQPRKFRGKHAVDHTSFTQTTNNTLQATQDTQTPLRRRPKHLTINTETNDRTSKHRNVGNPELAKIYQETGITKAISGTIHEAKQNHDAELNPLPPKTPHKELYWNPGHGASKQFGYYKPNTNRATFYNA